MKSDWQRVNKRNPCPICGKPDWCLVASDGSAAICQRIEDGALKRCGEAGWLHIIKDNGHFKIRKLKRWTIPVTVRPSKDFRALAQQYSQNLKELQLNQLATQLGVSVDSLRRLGIGWSGAGYSFPMRDYIGRIVGLRIRYPSGYKACEKGSHLGLFIPADLPEKPNAPGLLICEGLSDTATALDLGFAAVGRSSCSTGGIALSKFARGFDVVIIGDNDPPGHKGAESLGSELVLQCRSVKIVYPPDEIKDLRQWKQGGLNREQLESVIESSDVLSVKISIT